MRYIISGAILMLAVCTGGAVAALPLLMLVTLNLRQERERRGRMHQLAFSILFGLLLLDGTAMAACSVPNPLTNGTTADANAVMGNFTTLASCAAPLANPNFTGTVGINNASPVATLDIQASPSAIIKASGSAGSAALSLDRTTVLSSRSAEVVFSSGGASDFAVGTSVGGAAASDFSIYTYGVGNALTILKSNGNVGIQTVTPSYALTVNGTAYATAGAGALSDVRHKTNILELQSGALDEVMQLRPVSFQWKEPKDSGMKGRQIGFIAQDVEKILPSTVLTEDNVEKTKGLKYNELIAVLTKAVQEQEVEIRALKVANDKIANDFTHLKVQMGALEPGGRIQTASK